MPFSLISFFRSQLLTRIPPPTATFDGQTVIVTGSNVGLGKEAARGIVHRGAAKVILAVRNVEAGEAARKDIEESTKRPGTCEVWQLDMGSFESIKAFATKVSTTLDRLDAVLENAGVATRDFEQLPKAGNLERTIAVNVVGTFLLAMLLLPKLRESAKRYAILPRLSIVSSDAHGMATFGERKHDPIFPALSNPQTSIMIERYPLSKLLEIMTVRQIAPIMGTPETTEVVLNTPNPGLCHSELLREAKSIEGMIVGFSLNLLARPTTVGGGLFVQALGSGRETHGKYISDGAICQPDAQLVLSDDGEKTSRRVWAELKGILESIEPGVTENLKA